ncbi:hypothetical protein [Fluviicola sp.]|uniref:hypothetical protein n=1 Tax=Fluviicola sp. TaxID=1917219 RepID=UPI0031E13926
MKSLLIGFFQLLCVLQILGSNQLNAHPAERANTPFNFHHHYPEHSKFVVKHHKSSSSIDSNSSIPAEDTELIFENLEEETEDFSSGKHLYNNLFFAGIPVDQSLDYLYGNTKNSSVFCEQLSFITANKRHVVFQVFRI